MKLVHRNDLHRPQLRMRLNRSQRIRGRGYSPKARLVQVSKVLKELFELLETHGPIFYTKRHHNHATEALCLVGNLPSDNGRIRYA
jgi:hypothetical protein